MRLSLQAKLGKLVLISLVFVLILPVVIKHITMYQQLTISGAYIREDNRAFNRFLESIKKDNGVLVIGTSETGNPLDGNNFWHFLNKDKRIEPFFSVLGGAGRCSYIWFPTFIANKDAFSGLTILYFLNPTYWRSGLNEFHEKYYHRYNSPTLVRKIHSRVNEYNIKEFVDPYLERCTSEGKVDKLKGYLSLRYNGFRSFFSYDLRNIFSNGRMIKSRDYDDCLKNEIELLLSGLNLDYNVSEEYFAKNKNSDIPSVDKSSDFQYQALESFINLTKSIEIKLVVFVGPYNGILAQKNSPSVIPDYEKLLMKIKNLLETLQVPYIDGSDLSFEPGVFKDSQHHSEYGGWRIEEKIVANQDLF